jgi:hypothetical protein
MTGHYSSTEYLHAAAALRNRKLQPCALCGHLIDYTLTAPHPDRFSPDHHPPITLAGPHTNLRPAHLSCQKRQGGTITAARTRARAVPRARETPPSTGTW